MDESGQGVAGFSSPGSVDISLDGTELSSGPLCDTSCNQSLELTAAASANTSSDSGVVHSPDSHIPRTEVLSPDQCGSDLSRYVKAGKGVVCCDNGTDWWFYSIA